MPRHVFRDAHEWINKIYTDLLHGQNGDASKWLFLVTWHAFKLLDARCYS